MLDRCFGNATIRKDYLRGLGVNLTLLLLALLFGFNMGTPGSAKVSLGKMEENLRTFQAGAGGHTVYVLNNNIRFGLSMAFWSALPLYGPLLVGWRQGALLGIFVRSTMDGFNYPSFMAFILLVPHGIPEYAGFVLMESGFTMLQFSLLGILRSQNRDWRLLLRCLLASLVVGALVLAAAAIIECYLTPAIAGLLVS